MHWDEIGKRGNPAGSIAINDFITLLKIVEVKELGV